MSWQKILRDKIKSPQPNKTNSNFTQFQKSKNLGLKAHLPSTQSEAREAQTKTRDKSDQEDIYIDITTPSSIEMPTTLFLMAKKGKKENPENPKTKSNTNPRANPKATPKNQTQPKSNPNPRAKTKPSTQSQTKKNVNSNPMANPAPNYSDEEHLVATEDWEKRDRLNKVKEARMREEEIRTKKRVLAVKPPKSEKAIISNSGTRAVAMWPGRARTSPP